MEISNKHYRQGFAIIDAVVGMLMASIILFAFTSMVYKAVSISSHNSAALKADLFLSEIIEANRSLERTDFFSLSSTMCTSVSPCHVEVLSGSWVVVSGQEIIEGNYTRSFYIEDVYRDQSTFPNSIVTSGGVLDPNTKKIISQISWNTSSGAQQSTLEMYVYAL